MNFFVRIFLIVYYAILAVLPASKYVEGIVGQPESFLPSRAKNQNDRTISSLIYRGLFKYDIYGDTIPDLAETWTISDDGLVYTIKLKDNQFWTDGKKITSDDLIYTSFKVDALTGVATDKVDDLTVRYTLPNRYAPFLSLLTIGVMPVGAEENMDPLKPLTSGDFTVGRIEKTGSLVRQIVLVATNEKFNIKRMIFKYYTNDDELETAAKLGEIDAFMSQKTHELENFKDYKFPLQGIYYSLTFNLRNEKFKDQTLRQKLLKVLPIDDLINDRGIAVQGPISRSPFTDDKLVFDQYDDKFREGLKGETITITVPDMYTHKDLANRIQDFWEDRLGLNVEIVKVDPEKFLKDVVEPRNFEILLYGQEVGRDPDRYVVWYSSQKNAPGDNLSGFEQVRADRALEEGRKELDNDKRVIHYNEFQKVVVDQVPAIFLYHPYTHYYVTKRIDGIGEKYTFTQTDRFLDFANWKRVETN